MRYLVRITDRALRDLEIIFNYVDAENSEAAFAWFNNLNAAIYSLERLAGRGVVVPENKTLRQLLFGKRTNIYRIIYAVDNQNVAVTVLHIRHGARAPLPSK